MTKLLHFIAVISILLLMECYNAAVIEENLSPEQNATQSYERHLPYFEILRVRDGRDGRDGEPGPRGLPGKEGKTGATGPRGPTGPRSGGLTYIRWGRTVCPDTNGTELVYKGRAAGSHWSHAGGGSNYQCMTESPQNFNYGPGTSTENSFIYGAEYQIWGNNVPSLSHTWHNHDVPCAVCYVASRETVLMIPGTYICPSNWTREYYGYLMTERNHVAHKGRTTFECVDAAPEFIAGDHADNDGVLFHHVEPRCGSLPCPPYDQQKEITCAVCTR